MNYGSLSSLYLYKIKLTSLCSLALHQYCSTCHLDCRVRVQREWVGGREMGTEGVKAPVLGCNAWDHLILLCLHNQASWREWKCISQKKLALSLSLSLAICSSHFPVIPTLCVQRHSVQDPSTFGTECVGVDGREKLKKLKACFLPESPTQNDSGLWETAGPGGGSPRH